MEGGREGWREGREERREEERKRGGREGKSWKKERKVEMNAATICNGTSEMPPCTPTNDVQLTPLRNGP